MAYNTDPRLIRAIQENAPADLQPVLLATAWAESGGRLDAAGDGGRSHGPYQEYDLGRGAGLSIPQRRDPVGSTQRAVREFQQYARRGYTGGKLAAAAQRPANQGAYAQKVESLVDDARRALAGQATSTQRQSLATTVPNWMGGRASDPAASIDTPTTKSAASQFDVGDALASGIAQRRPGESLTSSVSNSLLAFAMSMVGQPAISQRDGLKANPLGKNPLGQPANGPGKPGVVNAAKRYIGTPYSWGGGTPSGPTKGFGRGANTVGFDCSSLVQMAWASEGVEIPRVTTDQIKIGRAISTTDRSQWRPGDLLFPHSGHVQMYIGNDRIIEAPRTGGHVQIVPASRQPIAVRRPRG